MSIRLVDIQAGFGGATPGRREVVSAAELAAELGRLRIERALARIEPEALETDVALSNDKLFAAAASEPMLIPCPIAVPSAGGDLPPEPEQVDAFIRRGAHAAVIRPALDGWLLADWVADPLLRAIEERRLPLLCPEPLVPLERTAEIAARFPALPLVVTKVGYRSQRILLPLLERFPEVHLSTGNNNCVHLGIEEMVRRVGPERLLFGTGFPVSEPMGAVTQLMYALISEEARALIGAGNYERLAGGIAR